MCSLFVFFVLVICAWSLFAFVSRCSLFLFVCVFLFCVVVCVLVRVRRYCSSFFNIVIGLVLGLCVCY